MYTRSPQEGKRTLNTKKWICKNSRKYLRRKANSTIKKSLWKTKGCSSQSFLIISFDLRTKLLLVAFSPDMSRRTDGLIGSKRQVGESNEIENIQGPYWLLIFYSLFWLQVYIPWRDDYLGAIFFTSDAGRRIVVGRKKVKEDMIIKVRCCIRFFTSSDSVQPNISCCVFYFGSAIITRYQRY